jgi:capsular polysaccharide biosynthesis protein
VAIPIIIGNSLEWDHFLTMNLWLSWFLDKHNMASISSPLDYQDCSAFHPT